MDAHRDVVCAAAYDELDVDAVGIDRVVVAGLRRAALPASSSDVDEGDGVRVAHRDVERLVGDAVDADLRGVEHLGEPMSTVMSSPAA